MNLNQNPLVNLAEIWTDFLNFWGQAWWIEVFTTQPKCIYYFGPFADRQQAHLAISGYVEDLESESAKVIHLKLEQCKPKRLTSDFEDAVA
ncbi:DUF1816 domain-containing protein [Chamaesiphon sp. GL140_3_metabinner_50]|uniref:DUF1816 domain-containing protein n=1 Tax=Chamaesiphon sp. GL140_3_metabinner_50 TaxID=2970812 RepID=UPI0025FD7D5F|nr:DUF1816 domain-containing protein [Chamaesiphon sp. GL140_3_metabinner_50]